MNSPRPALLLTGATGFLGRRLALGLATQWRVIGAARRPEGPQSVALDLEDLSAIGRAFHHIEPRAVVHSGAIAGPDDCERDPERARRVNHDASLELARLCAKTGARMIHISTDLVFDGKKGRYREEDATNPISVYGRVKRDAERAVLDALPAAIVLRVSSLYGRSLGGRPCYVTELRAALSQGKVVEPFIDQWRTPTDADQLPDVILRLLENQRLQGIFHWAGTERVNRREWAMAVCRAFGFDPNLIGGSRMADKNYLAPRPTDTSLDSSRLSLALGIIPRPLSEALAALKNSSETN